MGRARRAAAPELARAVQAPPERAGHAEGPASRSRSSDDPEGHEVTFLLAANPGEPPLPLAKVASGGELARAMLALRLVLTEAPDTLLFDEVDAGVGGEAALAVGRALAGLGQRHQVLVVTHLAQVAAFAEHQLVVDKQDVRRPHAWPWPAPVEGEARVVELARMLSGMSASGSARRHADELLDGARAVAVVSRTVGPMTRRGRRVSGAAERALVVQAPVRDRPAHQGPRQAAPARARSR